MKIKFKRMKILGDERTVKIIGECKNKEVKIELSILQLAKVFQCDKKVMKCLEEYGFGSEELEDKCEEIRNIIKKFPNIKIGKNEINVDDTFIASKPFDKDSDEIKDKIVKVCGEDLCGWNNEGIVIKLPVKLYDQELQGKEFGFILRQNSINLIRKT